MNLIARILLSLKLGLPAAAAVLAGCTTANSDRIESELSSKLDIAVREVMVLSREVRRLDQKLNVIQANLVLPDSMLSAGSGNASGGPVGDSFDLSGIRFLGSRDADIAIIEFTDYECPFCKQHFGTTYKQIRDQYVESGLVRYYVVDFPLSNHAFAMQAAMAARCAGEQDQFWEYHDDLFAVRTQLRTGSFTEIARSLDLDMPLFSDCLSKPAHQAHIDSLASQAQELGVSGTPTFLIGKLTGENVLEDGILLKGARPFSSFRDLISILRI